MSDTSLQQLEREVESARARLADDLASLRSPATFSGFTDDLKHEAVEAKDALLAKAKATASSTMQDIMEDLKAKAAANPGAALVVGAGLTWRLLRNPPIATALIGAGLFSLLRTAAPRVDEGGEPDYFSQAKERLKEQANDLGARVGQAASEAVGTVREQAAELADTAKEAAQRWSQRKQAGGQSEEALPPSLSAAQNAMRSEPSVERASQTSAETVKRSPRHTSSAIENVLNNREMRDNFLLASAGVAVAAALALAWQRQAADGQSPPHTLEDQ